MPTGQDFLNLAAKHLGEEYVYGAEVPLDDPDWHGPWDCAEFVTWVVYHVTLKIYGITEEGDPWTGAWLEDLLDGKVKRIKLSEAVRTPGAIFLRRHNGRGHISFSDGLGKTIEAKGTMWGVCRDVADPAERDWDYGILIPGVQYGTL